MLRVSNLRVRRAYPSVKPRFKSGRRMCRFSAARRPRSDKMLGSAANLRLCDSTLKSGGSSVHQHAFLVLPAGILLCWTAFAQISNDCSGKPERLGSVSFPVSCSAATQPRFDRAVALLHSFQYATAESAFAEIAKKDPSCAMAFWGQAVSLFQPLFELPNDDALSRGKELVALAVKTGVKTDRERDYIQASVVLYQ